MTSSLSALAALASESDEEILSDGDNRPQAGGAAGPARPKLTMECWTQCLAAFFGACVEGQEQTCTVNIVSACSGTGSPLIGLQVVC
eukprot:3830870-Amphidinium_carterae.1